MPRADHGSHRPSSPGIDPVDVSPACALGFARWYPNLRRARPSEISWARAQGSAQWPPAGVAPTTAPPGCDPTGTENPPPGCWPPPGPLAAPPVLACAWLLLALPIAVITGKGPNDSEWGWWLLGVCGRGLATTLVGADIAAVIRLEGETLSSRNKRGDVRLDGVSPSRFGGRQSTPGSRWMAGCATR